MTIRQIVYVVSAVVGLISWLTFGAGITLAVIEDNETLADQLLIGGLVGCFYTAISVALSLFALSVFDEERRKTSK